MTDREYIDIVEHNPITFTKRVVEALQQGYVVSNAIAGYPQFGGYGNVVRLFKGDYKGVAATTVATKGEGDKKLVEHYDPMHFLLALESHVQVGYTFSDTDPHFFDELGLKSVTVTLKCTSTDGVGADDKEEKKSTRKPYVKKTTKQ